MPDFLTVNEAARSTGRSTSSIRRLIYPILKDDQHPDRGLVQPSPDEAKALRLRGENFPWKLSEELLQRESVGSKKPHGGPAATPTRQDANAAQQLLAMLQRELDTKNQQIAQLNERLREGNILLGSFQKQLALGDGKQRDSDFVEAQTDRAEQPKVDGQGSHRKPWFFGRMFR